MLRVVWIVRNVRFDPVLVSRHPAGHYGIQEECDGSLCHCFVPVGPLIGRPELFGKKRTLELQVGIVITLNLRGESVDVGKARGFHQNPPQGVQPNMGSIATLGCPS